MRGRALTLGALSLLMAAALYACGRSTTVAGTTANLARPMLLVARVKDAIILDPAQATDGMSLNVTTEIVKGLVQFRLGTFDVEPAIAESWQMSPDGRSWTFHLRKGLQFSDGTPVDAEAVKFNFDRWRLLSDPYHGSFSYAYYSTTFGGFPGLIVDVRAPAPDTVVFRIARPFAPFLHDLALPAFGIASPTALRSDLEGFGQHPVGWGPYTLSAWIKNDRIILKANPNYIVPPVYQTVIVRDLDQAASVRAMESGEVDVLTDPTRDATAALSKTPYVTVYDQPANNVAYLSMNVNRKPFDKQAVREAVAYALDLATLVKTYYPSGAMVADNWTPAGMIGENPAVKAHPYDVAQARALLARAGYKRGFTTTLFYPGIPRPYLPEPKGVAEAVASQLRKAGIVVTLQSFDWPIFLDKIKHGEHAMALTGWSGDNGDPDNFLYALLDKDSVKPPNTLNYSFWRDDRFHDLMIAGQASSDAASRGRIYQEANMMVAQIVPAVPIVHGAVPIVVRTAIAGFVPSPDTRVAFEFLRPIGE